ncbi:MAG: choice-of-anchor L domain-containing protein, partial [Chitinophagales bacterium]
MKTILSKHLAATLLMIFIITGLRAQIVMTPTNNAATLAATLAGSGVTVTGATLSCGNASATNKGSGTFTGGNTCTIGIANGVALSSGNVNSIPNAAGTQVYSPNASTAYSNTANSDPDLNALAGVSAGNGYDKCVLTFNIVPQGNLLTFRYVFGSDEYPEYVCSVFNDVFGFFISGPNPGGGNYVSQNVALIPSTTLPVSINAVNPGVPGVAAGGGNCTLPGESTAYASQYINNNGSSCIVYDGMTKVFVATIPVKPCSTYTMKLAVEDIFDAVYDSGVLLEASSFQSNAAKVTVAPAVAGGFSSTYEGCVNGTFTISLPTAPSTNQIVTYTTAGTATNGVDYNTLPGTLTIPAGSTTATISLVPISDGIVEGTETVKIRLIDPCSGLVYDSASITIKDPPTSVLTVDDTTLCPGQNAQLTASLTGSGLDPATYAWSPAAGLSATNIYNPVANITANTSYTVTTSFGTCTSQYIKTINLYKSNLATSYTQTNVDCNGGSNGAIDLSVSNGITPYTYAWNGGVSTQDRSGLTAGTYTVTTTDGFSCTSTQTVVITQPTPVAIAGAVTNVSCNGGTNGAISLTASGGTPGYTYIWNTGATTSGLTTITAGTYSVTVKDSKNCSATASFTVTQPTALTASLAVTGITCNGANNGAITTTASGGTAAYTYNWGGGVTSQNRSGLAPGTYTVTVTDSKSCTATASVTLTEPAILTASLAKTNVTCNGAANGTITLTTSGGTAGYTYNWGAGIITQNRSGLAPGTYSVTVTDSKGCTASASATITQPTVLTASALVTPVSCNGGNNGAITLTVNGGSPAYGYDWGGGVTTQNRSAITAGTYSVTVTDNNGCTVTVSAVVTQPSALTVAPAVTNVNCYGQSTGAVNLTPAGGTAPYVYSWSNGAATQNITGLPSGNYTVTVTDSKSCTVTLSNTVTQPAAPLTLTSLITNVQCNGQLNGAINLTASGGTAAYSYNWGGGVLTEDRSGLTNGTYVVTVTDNKGCTATLSNVVSSPAALNITSSVIPVSCNGGNNGSIDITVTGGTTPYTYNWGGGISTEDRNNLVQGSYSITVTDANACTASATYSITQPTALSVAAAVTNVSCNGGNNGAINITPSGGTPAYTYNWGGGVISQNRSGLTVGTYVVTVTDSKGCTATSSTTITEPAVLSVSLVPVNVTCNGASNGTITSTVSGGTTAYSYNWGGAITTANRSGLAPGTYTVTVTDSKSCTATASSTITQPAVLTATAVMTPVSCNGQADGAIVLTVTGGNPAYTYNWGGGITTKDRTGLTAGAYTVTATDSKGCTVANTVTVTQPAVLSLTESHVNVSCNSGNNGSITLTATGGTIPYSFNWNGGVSTQNRSSLTAGTYTVTVTDGNGCSATQSITITQPAVLALTLTGTDVSCNGGTNGSITSTVTGGAPAYSYNWGGGIITANRSSLTAGTYSLTVTDNNGCSVSSSVLINQPAVLTVVPNITPVACNGGNNGAISLTVSGGTTAYTFNWGGGITTQDRTSLAAGTYSVTVTDAKGCTASSSSTITQSPAIAISNITSNVKCRNGNDGAIDITVSGGTPAYGYLWSNGASTEDISTLTAGTYTVTVSDNNSCLGTASIIVSQPSFISISPTTTNATCYGGSNGAITIGVSGGTPGYTFNWGGGVITQNRTGLVAGSYALTVTDANNCSSAGVFNINQPSPIDIQYTKVDVPCNGGGTGSITLSVSGGTAPYTYNWGGGIITANRTGLAAGSYTVTVTDFRSCTASKTITITEPAVLTASAVKSNVSCNGGNDGSITLTVAGGTTNYSFNWGAGVVTQDRTGLTAGTYTVTVTDAKGCTVTSSSVITQPAVLNATLVKVDVSCNGNANGSVTATITGGTSPYTYAWSNGATTQNLTGLSGGTYTLTVIDTKGCQKTVSAVVNEPAVLAVSAVKNDVTCFGSSNGSITLTVTGGNTPYSYNWGGGVTTQNRTALAAATYNVTVTDSKGCTATLTSVITQPALLVASVTKSNVTCNGAADGSINLSVNGGTPSYSYNWGGGITTQDRSALGPGTYTVTVTDANGCTVTVSASITQPAALTATATATAVTCNGAANGSVSLTVGG